jgi:hypothetical protein
MTQTTTGTAANAWIMAAADHPEIKGKSDNSNACDLPAFPKAPSHAEATIGSGRKIDASQTD